MSKPAVAGPDAEHTEPASVQEVPHLCVVAAEIREVEVSFAEPVVARCAGAADEPPTGTGESSSRRSELVRHETT
jgi:hypothetical protein